MTAPGIRLDSARELESLYAAAAAPYRAAIGALVQAVALGDAPALEAARETLDDVMGASMGVAEAIGSMHALQEAGRLAGEAEGIAERLHGPLDPDRLSIVFARPGTATDVPRVRFRELLKDLITRTPVTLRRAAERTARRIAELYAEGRVVAFVRSAERAVTERVQALLVEAVQKGLVEREAGTLIKMGATEVAKRTADWTEAYSRTVFRTNLNTAVTAGRFKQVQDPEVGFVIPALQFHSVNDADTRENHAAADGIVMRKENPEWLRIAPPLGYNCRCTVQFVSMPTLKRMGRINRDGTIREDRVPAGAFPDPGFRQGGRPDIGLGG